MSDLTIFGKTFTNVKGIKATDTDGNEVVYGGGGISLSDFIAGNIGENLDLSGVSSSPRNNLFDNMTSVKHIYAPDFVSVNSRSHLFSNMQNLESVDFPNLKILSNCEYTFSGNRRLVNVHFPKLFDCGDHMLENCTALTTVVIRGNSGSATSSMYRTFNGCTNLKVCDIGFSEIILKNYCFQNCTKLETLILRSSTINRMSALDALSTSSFKNGGTGGKIYIPKVLYDHLGDGSALDYKSATNWSTIDGYGTITWKPIEGSIYETQYADGTPIE